MALALAPALAISLSLTACGNSPKPRSDQQPTSPPPATENGTALANKNAAQDEAQKQRKAHASFLEEFQAFEAGPANKMWRCMFGRDGDGRRFNAPEGLNAALEAALFTDPRAYPDKLKTECAPAELQAAEAANTIAAPPEYREALANYQKALQALGESLVAWADTAPARIESFARVNQIKAVGEEWSTLPNGSKPTPPALQYDRFLRCAVPDIDKLADGQALLEFVAAHCISRPGIGPDEAYLNRLRDTCVVEAQTPPDKAPVTFKRTFDKLINDYDRMSAAWGTCFRRIDRMTKKKDKVNLDQAWADWLNAASNVRKLARTALGDSPGS